MKKVIIGSTILLSTYTATANLGDIKSEFESAIQKGAIQISTTNNL